MAEVRYDNSIGTLGADLPASGGGATTITFASNPGFATLTGSQYVKLVMAPSVTTAPSPTYEVIYLTAYSSGSPLTGTVLRAQEGTSEQDHPSGTIWACNPTSADFNSFLQSADNLSDVADPGTSRLNLHVPMLTPAAAVAVSNISSMSGLSTIDGYTLVAGDLVLLTAQTTASQNGLWTAASGAWTRPTEMASGGIIKARVCAVINGTTYAKTQWLLQTNSTITIDTTSQTWVEISGGGTSLEVTDGTHTVTGVSEINFTSGATVSSGGTGIADVSITGGGGSSTLAGLTDVSLSSPSAGQGLVYNASTGKWNNGNASAETVNTVASSGSGTITIPDPWSSSFETISDVTLTGNPTFAFPTAAAGKSFTVILRQDGTGGRTVTWPTVEWMDGNTSPVLSTAPSAVDIATLVCTDGSNWLGAFTPGYFASSADAAIQNGVIGATDLLIGTISINSSTGALTFTPAGTSSGEPAWVKSSSGVLTATTYGGSAKTITPSLPASTKYAVVGVEIDMSGNITLVKGVDTSTQLNTGSLIASNTPATSSGKMRIADFAIWNNAGVYNFGDHTTTPSQGVNWIDRRPWARGFNTSTTDSNSATWHSLSTGGSWSAIPNMGVRLECSGVPVEVVYSGNVYGNGTLNVIGTGVYVDGVGPTSIGAVAASSTTGFPAGSITRIIPTTGTHLFTFGLYGTSGSPEWFGGAQVGFLRECVQTNANNGAA